MVVFPNAKINIGLFVTEKRPDGFHNLETFFYPIGLSDVLEIVDGEGRSGEYQFFNTGIDIACETENNLIVKAYRLLDHDFHLPSVRIYLHKIIPFGAGLGGGSSDAAFMLKALNEYFELALNDDRLEEYASKLGSDCAFFVRNRPAFASGKGEKLEEMDLSLSSYRIVLVKPPFGVSTAEAYAGIRPLKADFDLHNLKTLSPEQWRGKVRNDFETTVFARYPRLADIKEMMYEKGAVYASMTGSGSAVYGLFPKDADVEINCPDCFVWKQNEMDI